MKKTLYFDERTNRLVKRIARKLSTSKEEVSESEVVRRALTVLPYEQMVEAISIKREQSS